MRNLFELAGRVIQYAKAPPSPDKSLTKTDNMEANQELPQAPSGLFSMNNRQIKVLYCAIAVIVLMGLFPPWTLSVSYEGVYSERPAEYASIFSGPQLNSGFVSTHVDVTRLILQWFIVVVIGATLIFHHRK